MDKRPPPEPDDFSAGYRDAYEASEDGVDLDQWVKGVLARRRDEKRLKKSA